MTESRRAQYVCNACNTRKKACDKVLPACSFCVKRKLTCRYDITAQEKRGYRPYNPGKHFVEIDSLSSYPSPSSNPLRATTPKSLNQQVHDILSASNLTPEDISERYFQVFHKQCPIISPELFNQRFSRYRRRVCNPPPDFSVLLLAMYLATLLPGSPHLSHLSMSDRDQLYENFKLLFAQAQFAVCTSLSLVQALLLMSICEYTCLRLEAAYVSMSTCSGLSRVLGIGKEILRTSGDGKDNVSVNPVEIEKANVVWAIAMTERIIVAELDQRSLWPLSEYPDPSSRLPSDLQLLQPLERNMSRSATLSCMHAADVSGFGRQAQAVFLLDQVLHISRAASKCRQILLSELTGADERIRTFLAVVIEEGRRKSTSLGTPVALTVRALFLLHRATLDVLHNSQNEDDHQTRAFSVAALDSACHMVVDTVFHSNQNPGDIPPICCYYNLQSAIQHLSEQKKYSGVDPPSTDLNGLLLAHEAYRSA